MNKVINKIADTVTEIIRELLETTEQEAKGIVFKYLNMQSGTFDYAAFQNIKKPQLVSELKRSIENSINVLNKSIDNVKKLQEFDDKKVKVEIAKQTTALYFGALKLHQDGVRRILRLVKIMPFKEAIFKQTQVGLDKGVRIATKRGTMGYKEYMEMSVRTQISTEIGEQQLKINADAKVVFYVSNVFRDSADDHADYQGKFYYDDRYKTFGLKEEVVNAITKRIRELKMLSVQQVRDGKPYLTTRPNCRHRLTPVTFDKVMNKKAEDIIKEQKLSTGTYRDKNYEDSQEQRYLERGIRKYKARRDENKKLYEQTGDEAYLRQSQQDQIIVSKWQKRLRELIEKNPTLERDYRRETRNTIVNDLGAKYNL